jgi:hypothetical protein
MSAKHRRRAGERLSERGAETRCSGLAVFVGEALTGLGANAQSRGGARIDYGR